MVKSLVGVTFSALVGLSFLAQAPPPPHAPDQGPPDLAAPAQGEDGRRKDTVRLFIVHKMRESLALSDAQTLKVLDALEAIDKEREASMQARRAILDRIQALVANPTAPDTAFKEAVAQFEKTREQGDAKQRELEDRLLAVMTPRQQAQFVLLRRQLMENIRQDVERGREGRPGGRPQERPMGRPMGRPGG